MSADGSGNLIIQLAPPPGRNKEDRGLTEQAPMAWQEINGQRVAVGVQYTVEPNGRVGFAVGQYNSAYALTIDPVLTFSTYLDGIGTEEAYGIAVESDGRVTIAGSTTSTNFTTFGHYPMAGSNSGSYDVFLAKFLAPPSSGTLQIFNSGYLGGSDADNAFDLAVDTDGRVYIAGETWSTNFPMVNPQQGTYSGQYDVFVAKAFPEYTSLGCRWPHTAGGLTTVYYKWGLGLEATGPGTWRTEAFEPGIASWNNLNDRIRYQFDATGSVTMRLYTLDDGKGGETIVSCSGGYIASVDLKVNTFTNSSPNPAVTAHEQGHALSLGHISSATISLMGNNPNGAVSVPQTFDDELVDTIYP